jgi:hypothetical protein
MMGHRSRLICGDEHDAFTRFRRLLAWRPGERRAAKQAHNQRERKRWRLVLLACRAPHQGPAAAAQPVTKTPPACEPR